MDADLLEVVGSAFEQLEVWTLVFRVQGGRYQSVVTLEVGLEVASEQTVLVS